MFMKTSTKQNKTNDKERTELVESFVLWIHKSKSGIEYLTGNLSEKLGSTKLVGYFNTNKKNPKEPDIRVYTLDPEGNQDKEIASLWNQISKNDNQYLTGTSDEKERLVGFYNNDDKHNTPYIRVYFNN